MTESGSDPKGSRLGMWPFLYTEIILFTGLFILYAAYFKKYPSDFAAGGKELSLAFGTINTIILLISSFAVAASITAIQKQSKKLCAGLIAAAVMIGGIFLVNKFFEWSAKIHHGIYPNAPDLVDGPPGENIFFGLYYVITGLHGIHIIIGMVLLSVCVFMILTNKIHAGNDGILENCGLYWHLVDIIWIFIFPLFYLII
jgi:cytochrome c oxidase subunit 3